VKKFARRFKLMKKKVSQKENNRPSPKVRIGIKSAASNLICPVLHVEFDSACSRVNVFVPSSQHSLKAWNPMTPVSSPAFCQLLKLQE
jgi:hypothetical protein